MLTEIESLARTDNSVWEIAIFIVANAVTIINSSSTNFQQIIFKSYINFSYLHLYKIYISSGQGVK